MDDRLLQVKTPAFVIDQEKLINNLSVLKKLQEDSGCKILLAQKCFSTYSLYELMGKYLAGTTASGLYEAKLGSMMGKENHVFSPAYKDEDMDELLEICDHIVFNSFSQWIHFKEKCLEAKKHKSIDFGLRINPECSTQEGHAIYDPCSPFSRMGITIKEFEKGVSTYGLDGIDGLHFHTLCEQNADDLEITLNAVFDRFGKYLKEMKWLNFGGGHHITRKDYNISLLKKCIKLAQDNYGVNVILEPGEAVALDAGYMVSTVLDIIHNDIDIAIMDTSAACHMPDIIEMPYTPEIYDGRIADKSVLENFSSKDSDLTNNSGHLYRLAGPTCLAGDIIGDYILNNPLNVGDKVVFKDMAIYTMVKTNTFNGMPLPDIVNMSIDGLNIVRKFNYEDFKNRL